MRLSFALVIAVTSAMVVSGLLIVPGASSAAPRTGDAVPAGSSLPAGANWYTYLDGPNRTSNTTGEVLINQSNAKDLTPLWKYNFAEVSLNKGNSWNASAAPQAIDVNQVVYEGSWDGYEYAFNATTGVVLWQKFLGLGPEDVPLAYRVGITSTPTYYDGILYLAGGNTTLYALNASTGAILWSTLAGKAIGNYYLWTSPLVTTKYIYLGLDSYFDNPLVPSGLNQYYRSNGTLLHTFNTSYQFINGSGIWSSPSISPNGSLVFVSTANSYRGNGIYDDSILAFNSTTLKLVDFFHVPKSQIVGDGDFGATPILYSVPTAHGSVGLVTAQNKNGILYTLYQSNLTELWWQRVSNKPGNHTITTAAWNGEYLYDTTLGTTIDGVNYNGSIIAFEPLTGTIVWQDPLTSSDSPDTYAGPLCFNGMVVVSDNKDVLFYNATTGHLLHTFDAGHTVMAAPSVSRGEMFLGTYGGIFIALGFEPTSAGARVASVAPGTAFGSYLAPAAGSRPTFALMLGAFAVLPLGIRRNRPETAPTKGRARARSPASR